MRAIMVTDRHGVREVAIDRPEKRNALTRAMYDALSAALGGARAAGARAVWLHGSEICFTAGNDLGDFAQAIPGERSAAWAFLEALVGCDVPVVASVNGAAVGIGTTLLLHCDLVYCSAGAMLQLPFVTLGLCPEAGSSLLLPALAGAARAAEWLLLGEPFGPEAAREAGLVNAVLPSAAEADAMGQARAAALAAQPPEALRASRELLRGRTRAATLAAIREEGEMFARLLHGPEAREALSARLAKRTPGYTRTTPQR